MMTDYIMMEAYKAGDEKSFLELMDIVCEFPEQLFILKATGIISKLRGRSSGLTRRMIEPNSREMVSSFCEVVSKAKKGQSISKDYLEHRSAANQHLDVLLANATKLIESFNKTVSYFSPEEEAQLRSPERLSGGLIRKILDLVEELAVGFLKTTNYQSKIPKTEFVNLYVFRFALCGVLLILRWVRNGTNKLGKQERVRNDLVDICLAAYSTYFDGPLTNDKAMTKTYNEAWVILKKLGAAVGR